LKVFTETLLEVGSDFSPSPKTDAVISRLLGLDVTVAFCSDAARGMDYLERNAPSALCCRLQDGGWSTVFSDVEGRLFHTVRFTEKAHAIAAALDSLLRR
jgi:hypothetical protein